MTAFDRPDFVLAVSIERGELQLERAVGAAEVQAPFLSVVADDQRAALVGGREHYHQRRDHPVQPLAVAMWQEKAAGFIQQQLVEMTLEALRLKAQLGRNSPDGSVDERWPCGIRQRKPVAVQLEDVSHTPVDDRAFVPNP